MIQKFKNQIGILALINDFFLAPQKTSRYFFTSLEPVEIYHFRKAFD